MHLIQASLTLRVHEVGNSQKVKLGESLPDDGSLSQLLERVVACSARCRFEVASLSVAHVVSKKRTLDFQLNITEDIETNIFSKTSRSLYSIPKGK